MMNRRNFLKASLAGGAVTALNQIPVQATPTTSPAPDLMTDAVPERKGKSVLGLRCQPIPTVPVRYCRIRSWSRSRRTYESY